MTARSSRGRARRRPRRVASSTSFANARVVGVDLVDEFDPDACPLATPATRPTPAITAPPHQLAAREQLAQVKLDRAPTRELNGCDKA